MTTKTIKLPTRDQGAPQEPRRRLVPISAGAALLMLDALGLAITWPLGVLLLGQGVRGWPLAAMLLVMPVLSILGNYALGLYRREAGAAPRRALARVPMAATVTGLGTGLTLWLLAPSISRVGVSAGLCALIVGVGARAAFDILRRQGLFTRQVLILGAGSRAFDLVFMLQTEGRTLGYRFHLLHDPALGQLDPRLANGSVGQVRTLGPGGIREAASAIQPDEIVVAPDERRGMDLQGLLDCKIAGFPVSDYLGFIEREVRRVDVKRIEMGWLLYSDGFTMGPLDRALKRLLDLSASILMLVLVAPVLFVAMALIRLQDGGPALYRQDRVTLGGRVFSVLKLRTMRVDAEKGGAAWAKIGDSRVTRLGTFLRKVRLDELPQLVNVLRGEMSFVGPRPERPEFVDMLAGHLPLYRERHAAKAGLTGWAQVNYPYGASIDDARSKLSYDLYYVKNFSVLFDILIILQTIRVVLFPGGAR